MKKPIKIISYSFIILILFSGVIQSTPRFFLMYVVQSGDTIFDIADKYNVSVESIIEVNNLSEGEWIRTGDEIIIPDKENIEEPESDTSNWDYKLLSSENKRDRKNKLKLDVDGNYAIRVDSGKDLPEVDIPEDEIINYHVKSGDTLFDLANQFNTSTGVIMALNDMETNIIRNEQTLKLPINNLTPREVLAETISEEEVELLARAIYGEARGEPFKGQVAVGAVIVNRVISSSFPDNIYDVIYQPGQFSIVNDGQIDLTPNKTAFDAARRALEGYDPTMGALYYYNPNTAQKKQWFSSKQLMVTIGEHVFGK
ncbi:MAG: cell wall hydrolase [Bacillota bacterium]